MSMVLDVYPSGYADTARVLGNEVAECVRLAWIGLGLALDDVHGMAGTDGSGAAWAESYESAASAASSATEDVVNGCYQLAALLEQTGLNYGGAESASVPGGSAPEWVNRWATSSVSLGVVASAVGLSHPSPPGWATLQHAIGRLWPDGHQDLLHTAGQAWRRAQQQVLSVLSDVGRAEGELAQQRAPEVGDAVTVVHAMSSHLADLAATYGEIGAACTAYAHHLDEAHHAIIAELTQFLEVTAAIEAAGGLLAVFTAGVSELAAQGGEAAEVTRVAMLIRSIIDAYTAVVGELRAVIDAVAGRIAAIADRMQPILARRLQQVRLAAASDRGEITVGRKLAGQASDTSGAAATPEGAAIGNLDDTADIGPASETWSDLETLYPHYTKHGADFEATSAGDYAQKAANFRVRAAREHLPIKVKSDGSVRIYDPETNTFGSYSADGKTRTFFKPTSRTYWQRQSGVPQ